LNNLDDEFKAKLFDFIENDNDHYKVTFLANLAEELSESICAICQSDFTSETVLLKCGHLFC